MLPNKTQLLLLTGGPVIILDLMVKYAIRHWLPESGWWLTPGYGLDLLMNKGAAGGLLSNINILPLTVALTLLLIIWFYQSASRGAVAIIIGGAVGNIIDRLVNGAVTDFVVLGPWPTSFNLADLFITAGVLWLLIEQFKKNKSSQPNS